MDTNALEVYVPRIPMTIAHRYEGHTHPLIKKCIGRGSEFGPVPAGLEVLGSTCKGFEIKPGQFVEINPGDWVLEYKLDDGPVQYEVVSPELFARFFTKVTEETLTELLTPE